MVAHRVVRALAVIVALAAGGLAFAADYTLDELYFAWERGYSSEVLTTMAGSGERTWDIDSETVVKLIRAGFPVGVIRTMTANMHPTPSETEAAKKAGPKYEPARPVAKPAASVSVEDESLGRTSAVTGPEYVHGFATWTYTGDRFVVSATVMPDGANTAVFFNVVNLTNEKIDVMPQGARLQTRGSYEYERIPVSSYVKKIENAATWRAVGIGLAAVSMSYSTSTTTSSGSARVSSSGYATTSDGGSAYASGRSYATAQGRSTTTTSTAADKLAAAEWAERQLEESRAREEQRLQEADDLLLKAHTVAPGEFHSGVVPFKHKSASNEKFVVMFEVGGESIELPGLAPD
jgi:hypothetical protein